MLENLGWPEIICLILLALFIFGPERLPKVAADAARLLRKARAMARGASQELQAHLPDNVDVTDLNPKTFVRKHLLSEEDEEAVRRPFQQVVNDLDAVTKPSPDTSAQDKFRRYAEMDEVGELPPTGAGGAATRATPARPKFDPDAT